MAGKEERKKWVLGGLISVHIVFNKISMLLAVTYVILNIVSIILCINLQENFIYLLNVTRQQLGRVHLQLVFCFSDYSFTDNWSVETNGTPSVSYIDILI